MALEAAVQTEHDGIVRRLLENNKSRQCARRNTRLIVRAGSETRASFRPKFSEALISTTLEFITTIMPC